MLDIRWPVGQIHVQNILNEQISSFLYVIGAKTRTKSTNWSRNGLPETACVHVASRMVPLRPASLSDGRSHNSKVKLTECRTLGGQGGNTRTKCIKQAN